jgi:uncharacterized protein YprB with RNaseH-like and TPR domain
MSTAPVHRMKKDQMVWLGTHRCRHGHTYLEHYSCYLDEVDAEPRIGYFDIESSNLKADFGFCICWYILDEDNRYHGRTITKQEVLNQNEPDKKIMQELISELERFDIIYTYYGTKFDLPFVRTRCIINGLSFPFYGSLKHKDIFYVVKNKFNLHRKSLEVACEVLLGESNKTHWMTNHWIGAVQGKKKSLDYIDDHCRNDVKDLKALAELTMDYVKPVFNSI